MTTRKKNYWLLIKQEKSNQWQIKTWCTFLKLLFVYWLSLVVNNLEFFDNKWLGVKDMTWTFQILLIQLGGLSRLSGSRFYYCCLKLIGRSICNFIFMKTSIDNFPYYKKLTIFEHKLREINQFLPCYFCLSTIQWDLKLDRRWYWFG